ncbi:uncharacterized protein SRS1_15246 [Sporisorium reilianum f. sp. reilianum]|uniref:Uncharacterized protein n=1 Tax=Sporisorium reilianum f. sp. reilianum TaxID=72559 RepID=A0A2N8UIR4_9BASI|nr:uncharacterized protein SRS1_15246 [Sporisorium reilianum f. sp. reilianum]
MTMQTSQPQRPPRSALRSQSPQPPDSILALQSSALERLSKMNAAAQVSAASYASSSSSQSPFHPSSTSASTSDISSAHTTSTSRPSGNKSTATLVERTDAGFPADSSHRGESNVDRSQKPSSSSRKPSLTPSNASLSDFEGYGAFFDDYYSPRGPSETLRSLPEPQVRDSGFQPLELDFLRDSTVDQGSNHDDDENLKDLIAYKFPRSLGMNLDTFTRSSADHYAYSTEGYSDPNAQYGAKAVDDAHETPSIEDSYAHLISRLSLAHDGASIHEERRRNHRRSYEQSAYYTEESTPKTSSFKDSPLAASLTSASSSSDAHDDELRTPPEPNFNGFEPSVDETKNPSTRHPSVPTSVQPSFHAQTPPSASIKNDSPHLGSPFQPAQLRTQQSWQPGDHVDTSALFGRYDIGNSSELELLSDDVTAQRSAAGKAKMTPRHSPPPQSIHGHERRGSSSAYAVVESNKPFTRLGPQDVVFSASTLPERHLSAADCIDIVVSRYPSICDAPVHQLGEDGLPLPPTKKQETSEEERQARREALQVKFCAKQRLSLIKAMVVMESRSASWKRIGAVNSNNKTVHASSEQQHQNETSPRLSGEVGRLPPMPSPWSMELRHEQLDVAQIKGKSKKTIELASLRTNAQCVKCEGSGLGACLTCKAEQADECFWCNGTGREKMRAQARCRRCQGEGVLKCNTCHGSLKSQCGSCEGKGTGEYGFFVDVTVKRVEMPAVPISTLFPQFDPASTMFEPSYDEVKAAATLALWDSITKLTDARAQAVVSKGGKAKSKEMVPVMAACTWENSITHVVAVDVPQAAKFKKGATPALRPEGLHRKIPTKRRFFTVPTDADLRSVELSEAEVKQLGALPSSTGHTYQRGSVWNAASAHPPSPMASYSSSPALSTVDLGGRPLLATPEQGGSVSGYSTPSRVPSPRSDVPPAKPAAKEFVHRPSPLSQLAVATPPTSHLLDSASATEDGQLGGDLYNNPPRRFDGQDYERPPSPKGRRPSSGNILAKKLSSNILHKLGAHRGSV